MCILKKFWQNKVYINKENRLSSRQDKCNSWWLFGMLLNKNHNNALKLGLTSTIKTSYGLIFIWVHDPGSLERIQHQERQSWCFTLPRLTSSSNFCLIFDEDRPFSCSYLSEAWKWHFFFIIPEIWEFSHTFKWFSIAVIAYQLLLRNIFRISSLISECWTSF